MDAIHKVYDVMAMGRSSIDLYSNDIGAPFVEISSFAAYVGGCPTNISVGTRRLGLRPALLTAVGTVVVSVVILLVVIANASSSGASGTPLVALSSASS